MAYQGNIELINGIVQKNSGNFPLVDSSAVRVTDATRLDEYMLAFLSVLIEHVDSFNTNISAMNSKLNSIKNDVAYIRANLGNVSPGSGGGSGGEGDDPSTQTEDSGIEASLNNEQIILTASGDSNISFQNETLVISNSSTAYNSSSETLVI